MRFPTKHAAAASIAAATTITALAGTALAGTALTGTALAAQRQGSARVLGAGQTGTAAQVPWRQVGPGWELVQYDATTDTAGHIKPGPQTLYLVDPAGGRYQMYQWPAKAAVQPILADWSGDKARALFTEGTNVVQQLNLTTSQITSIRLARAQFLAYASYTRPAGSSIVVANGNTQRVTIDSLRGSVLRSLGANSQNAIQSADGRQYVLPGGSGLRLTSSSGKLIRRLPVPGAGCLPVRYWSASTVLASCQVNRNGTAGRLWLVPLDRRAPSAITSARVRMPVIANPGRMAAPEQPVRAVGGCLRHGIHHQGGQERVTERRQRARNERPAQRRSDGREQQAARAGGDRL